MGIIPFGRAGTGGAASCETYLSLKPPVLILFINFQIFPLADGEGSSIDQPAGFESVEALKGESEIIPTFELLVEIPGGFLFLCLPGILDDLRP